MAEKIDIIVRLRNLASKPLVAIDKGISNIGRSGLALGKVFTSLQGQLVAFGATFAAGAFAKSAISTFTEFDDTMRAVGAVTGATGEEFKLLTDTAKEMGKTTRFSASQAADGLRLLGMAGFEAKEASEALPGVLNLAAAGGLELGQAADIATNILAGFGLEVEDLASVNDVLVKTFTSSNSTLVELGEAFKLVGPIAAGVGADFEDLIANIGKLHDAGLKGTLAGTALRGALDALLNPTAQEAELMEKLRSRMGGVALEVKDGEGNFIGFQKIIEQLQKAGLKGEEALRLFGLRAGPGMAALLGVGEDKIKDFVKELKNSGYISDKIAAEMEAGIGGATREMAAAYEAVQIEFGEAFNDELIKIIRNIRDWFINLAETIKRLDEDGTLASWTQTAKQSLNVVITIAQKLINLVNVLSKSLATAAAAAAGDWKAVQLGLQDINQELKEFYGFADKETPAQKFKITDEQKDSIRVLNKETGEFVEMTREAYKEYEKLQKASKRGPIGRRTKSVQVETVEVGPGAEAMAKAEFKKLQAIIDNEMALLDTRYELGVDQVKEYFDQRQALIKRSIEAEIAEYQRAVDQSDDPDKRIALQAKIFEKRKELETALLQLTAERIQEEERLEAEKLKKEEELANSKLEIERVFQDQKERLAATAGEQLQTQFSQELIDLQTKHAQEIAILQEHNATKAEIEEAYRNQQLEKDRVAQDQWKRLMEARLDVASTITGSMSSIFSDMYQLSGEKNKEFFIASKAAAIAQATINTAQAITKALAEGGPYTGPILAAVAAAAGAIQIAKITSTNYAEGGKVEGHSPHKKADNISAKLTAGEFVHPVDAVQYYGTSIMEALRRRAIPKEVLQGFGHPMVPRIGHTRFAAGGSVAAGPQDQTAGGGSGENININNFIDPALFSQHVQSTSGERDVMNVLSRNQFKLKQLVLSQ